MKIKPIVIARIRLIAASIFFLIAISGCRVPNPNANQTIPVDYNADQSPTEYNVQYGEESYQLLDVYSVLEDGEASSGIAIVYVHGGGWRGGDKGNIGPDTTVRDMQYLMDKGHVVFSINYTLNENCAVGPGPFPQNVLDVKLAIAWANHPDTKALYNYDKVVVAGSSAGATLATLAALSDDRIHPTVVPEIYNPHPDAILSFGGPSDMSTFGAQGTAQQQVSQVNNWGVNFVQCFWGESITHPSQLNWLQELVGQASFWLDASDPPIYIASGVDDPLALAEWNADILEGNYAAISEDMDNRAYNDRIENGEHLTAHGMNVTVLNSFLKKVAEDSF